MKKIIISIILLILIILGYGFFLNPNMLTTKDYKITSSKIPESFKNLKIAHFSDVLIGNNKTTKDLEKIVNKINENKVDIIFFTGDLISKYYNISDEEKEEIIKILSKLNCNLYKYAVIGDNDQENLNIYKEILQRSDFNLLDNSSTHLFYKDVTPIEIIGISDYDHIYDAYLGEENINPSYFIVLTHFPDYASEIKNIGADLILAGHSLGGKIRLPFVGGIIKKDGAKTYVSDYYKLDNTELYVSRGIGNEGVNVRFLDTPTINFYYLNN